MSSEEIIEGEGEQAKALKHKGLAINNIDLYLREAFIDLAKSRGVKQKELFADIFNNYQNLRLEFDAAESKIMQEAHAIAPRTLNKRIKKMVLRYAQALIDTKDKPAPAVDIRIKNSARAANARADALLAQIFTHNEQAANWYDKILITKSSMLDYAAKRKQGDSDNISLGKVVLNRCLERNKELIALHHEDQKLTEGHNAIAHYERLKADKGGNL